MRPISASDNRFASVGREQNLGSPPSISSGNRAAAEQYGSFLYHSSTAPASRTHSLVQESHFLSKVSNLGQVLPDERSLTLSIETPGLGPPKTDKPGISTVPVYEPAPADQGHIHDSSDAFDGGKDDESRCRNSGSGGVELIENDASGVDTTARAGEFAKD